MAVAAQEGPEIRNRMTKAAEAIHSEQSRSVNTADDLLPLLHDWLSRQKKERQGVELTASEIGASLMMHPGIGNGLYKILGSSMLLSNKLTSSSEYIRLLGMRVVNGKRPKNSFSTYPRWNPNETHPTQTEKHCRTLSAVHDTASGSTGGLA